MKERLNVHLTHEAMRILERYSGPRGRGDFISRLIVEYDQAQKDGDRVIWALRERVKQDLLQEEKKPPVQKSPSRRKRRR